jgi:hypothetical protein
MNPDPVKQAWQASVEIPRAPSLDEVRKGADKFYRYVKWRNCVEYTACAVVVAVFTVYIFTLPHVLQKVGSALIIVATFFAAWQLHRRASAEAPEKAGTMPILAFARGQLVRHRDALRGVFGWYILPFIPGLGVMMVGNALNPGFASLGAPPWVKWLSFAGVVAIIGVIWWLNQLAARKLQRHIDEIDALTGVGE